MAHEPWWLPLVDLLDAQAPLTDYEEGFVDALMMLVGQPVALSAFHRDTIQDMLTHHAAVVQQYYARCAAEAQGQLSLLLGEGA
jgi:hypothetical protein